MPDCDDRPSDCEDVAVINTLDGFNVTTRTLTPGRTAVGSFLSAHLPSLINTPGVTNLEGVPVLLPPHYNENLPLRSGETLSLALADSTIQTVQSPVITTVAGAMEIQEYLVVPNGSRNRPIRMIHPEPSRFFEVPIAGPCPRA